MRGYGPPDGRRRGRAGGGLGGVAYLVTRPRLLPAVSEDRAVDGPSHAVTRAAIVVVVPARDEAANLGNLLESVAHQTTRPRRF